MKSGLRGAALEPTVAQLIASTKTSGAAGAGVSAGAGSGTPGK